jgi:excisionase family DNA binding protein
MSTNLQLPCLPNLVGATEIAESTGASRQYIYALAKRRQIPHYRFGYMIKFDPDEIAKWFNSHKVD